MTPAALLLWCSLAFAPPCGVAVAEWRAGTATTFGVSSEDAGNPDDTLACAFPRRLGRDEWAVASYVLPCGALLWLCGPRRCAIARVLDRGPRRTKVRPELAATDLDLSTALSRALGVPGTGPILWGVVR